LQRLNDADALLRALARLLKFTGAGPSLAAMFLGLLIAPMNGSVTSSSALLGRLLSKRLDHLPTPQAVGLISAASTVGVVVPPSLVLLLLGDAMLRAHTEAMNLPGLHLMVQQIINTQDVFHAALLPAAIGVTLWMAISWWQGRRFSAAVQYSAVALREWLSSAAIVVLMTALLGGIFMGRLLAVEAAAAGCMVLLATTICFRRLSLPQWKDVLSDTMNLTGALLALLVGATTFSLVFHLFATDQWIVDTVLLSPWSHPLTAASLLVLVAACASVIDAFEMIFMVMPVVAPLLIALLGDAQQAAVLVLLVLQLSFIIPPMGYAVMMTRARMVTDVGSGKVIAHALLPFISAQLAVIALVFIAPATVHLLDGPSIPVELPTPAADLDQQLRDMAAQSK
jgi:TRAP-type mannitol/chloroaromatic compound transport system permease large subunit